MCSTGNDFTVSLDYVSHFLSIKLISVLVSSWDLLALLIGYLRRWNDGIFVSTPYTYHL